jgi:hypothetical protein
MGAGIWLMALYVVPAAGGKTLPLLIWLSAAIAAGIAVYTALHLVFRSPELGAIAEMLKGKKE